MRTLFAAAVLLLGPALLNAQDYRATLLGTVTDASGATVPGARLAATNMESGVVTNSQTNPEGSFVIPYLLPGRYSLRVEQPGFKTFERSPIELRVNDRVRLDVRLEVGQLADRVTVIAEAPLLETSTSNRGQVIENRKITDLPLNGRNPFTLMNLSSGVQYTGSLTYFRPFDNGSINDFSINGGRNSVNDFQIDGQPDVAYTNRSNNRIDIAYVPPAEATQEFKIQTNSYDAQYGRTGGGVISLSIKPGSNRWHGAGYEYMRRTGLEANQYANNASNKPRADRLIDQYGFEVDGPVKLPKLYNGKDRTFFMFALEKYREKAPQPTIGSVPTAEQRNGDFSQTLTSANRLYTIYDPFTLRANPAFDAGKAVTLTNMQYLRDPFAGNRIPKERMNAIATRVLQDIPLPNQSGDNVTHANNWFAGDAVTLTDFLNFIGRVDHNFSDRWKMFVRGNHSFRDGGRKNQYSWQTPARQQSHSTRNSDGGIFDVVGTLSPTTVFSARLGFNRFVYNSVYTPQDLSELGFPAALLAQMQMPGKYPLFKWEGYIGTSVNENDILPSETYSLQASLMKIIGRHSTKFGGEFRIQHYASIGRTNGSGTYSFTRGWTTSNPQVDDRNTGNAMASFLLGYMDSANIMLNATPFITWHSPALFFQDDWQVNPRLTLNLGLRWDQEMPPMERHDRQNRGFDRNAKSPFQVAGMDVKGGVLFAGANGSPRGAFDNDRSNWQPRFGLAYKMLSAKPLVFRAGIGRYYMPTTEYGGDLGFAQVTNAQTSTTGYLPLNVLSNPFPLGLIRPGGASLGFATQGGDSVLVADPGRVQPYVWQYSAGFQFELTPGTLIELGYGGSQSRKLMATNSINSLTVEQLKLGTSYLSQAVTNPFYGVLPANTSRGAQKTIQRRSLLQPFPQFTDVTLRSQSLGSSWYNSMQFKFEQRLRRGLSYLVSYTFSKTMEAAEFLNPQDAALSRELVSFDTPHRLAISGIYEFPVGPGKRWANSGVLARIVGGWQVNWSGIVQSGVPMPLSGSYYLLGDPKLSSGQTLNRWFNTSPNLWQVRPPDTLRTTKLRSNTVRGHTAPQFDLSIIRDFRIREGHKVQFKVSAFNATNTPVFDVPNSTPSSPLFGVVPITQRNLPRSVEIGFRYAF